MAKAKELTKDEILKYQLEKLATDAELNRESFPCLYNISSAFIHNFLPSPKEPLPPEFIYCKPPKRGDHEHLVAIATWNGAWESAQHRCKILSERLPNELSWLQQYDSQNLYILPLNSSFKYDAYASLFHLIPHKTLDYHGLPRIKRGNWPHRISFHQLDLVSPRDFNQRLQRAFAHHIWPLIDSGSKITAFSSDDSLSLLAHDLDFWLPYSFQVAENRLRGFSRVGAIDEECSDEHLNALRSEMPDDIEVNRPYCGGSIWEGEEDAWEATRELIQVADGHGRLRSIIDAIRSNRVEDDFSDQWSFAKEDFERQLYSKRSKVKVTFVQLNDAIPVHGPDSEVHSDLLWGNLMAFADKRERKIIVCLRNGVTNVGEISKELGYANHSPISKSLAKIRNKAKAIFE